MKPRDRIALNFFPLAQQEFNFSIYRHSYNQGDKKENYPDCRRRKLPSDDNVIDNPIYIDYWVSFDPVDGFDKYTCSSFTNIPLSIDYLYRLLKSTCSEKLAPKEFELGDGFRGKMIFFVLDEYSEGKQTIWLEPYFLRQERKFGFLADFKFLTQSDTILTQRILQLSLSLDKDNMPFPKKNDTLSNSHSLLRVSQKNISIN